VELVIALVALITVVAVYAVVMWIDTPTPPSRPPSAPAAFRIWSPTEVRVYPRQRFAPRWRKVEKKTPRRAGGASTASGFCADTFGPWKLTEPARALNCG
jgi:hypothetical protein